MKKAISIRLDQELIKKLDKLAKETFKDRTELITEAIVKLLKEKKK